MFQNLIESVTDINCIRRRARADCFRLNFNRGTGGGRVRELGWRHVFRVKTVRK